MTGAAGPPSAEAPYWRLSGYYFFYFAFIGAFSPYFGLLLKARGFSAWDIGVLLSQMQLMRLFGPTVWGWISDRTGQRIAVIRWAGALSCGGLLGGFWAETFFHWLWVLALMAFFWSAALPLVETLTLDHLRGRQGRYGRIRLWGSVGFIVAVLATGWLLDHVPVFGLLGVLLVLLLGVFGVAMTLRDIRPVPGSVAEALPWVQVIGNRRIRVLLMACFAMSAAHGALYVFYSIHLDGVGHNRTTVGALWSLGVIAEIGVFLAMNRMMARFSLEQILCSSLWMASLRFLMIGWGGESLSVLIIAQLMHGITFGAYHAAAISAVQAWFPVQFQGRGQALYSSVSFGAGGLLGGLVAGAMWDRFGGPITYTLSAGFALAGAVAFAHWMPKNDDGDRSPRR